jgi:hypothetical protein
MKHSSNAVRAVLFLLIVLLLLPLGCQSKQESSEMVTLVQSLISERDTLENRLRETEQERDTLKTKLEAAEKAPEVTTEIKEVEVIKEVTKEVEGKYAYGLHCTVNGQASVKLDGSTSVKCVADKIDDYVFDHWELNGVKSEETKSTATFTLSENTTIEAIYHERHVVTCINCHIQFLNDQNNAKGSNYTEFDFEEEYTNPVTKKKCEGGKISFYIFADIPSKKEVDYWLINGVKYQYPNNVTKFRVENLDEATVYEVVYKGQTTKKTTDTPKTYYNVTCHSCTFKGDGKSGTSGKVAAGSTITITGTSDSSEAYFDGTPSSVNRHFPNPTSGSSGKYVFSFSIVVNSDVEVWFRGVVN